jgi:hypothetical protein
MIDFLLDVFQENKTDDAIVWRDQVFSYDWLKARVEAWAEDLAGRKIEAGSQRRRVISGVDRPSLHPCAAYQFAWIKKRGIHRNCRR